MAKRTVKIRSWRYQDDEGKFHEFRAGGQVDPSDVPEEALERAERLGVFVDEKTEKAQPAADVSGMDDDELDAWFEDNKPNVKKTVAAMNGDPELAKRILAAENRFTGNEAREGVIKAAEKIIGSAS